MADQRSQSVFTFMVMFPTIPPLPEVCFVGCVLNKLLRAHIFNWTITICLINPPTIQRGLSIRQHHLTTCKWKLSNDTLQC